MVRERTDRRRGDPLINFAMGILLDAKRDAELWTDYMKEFGKQSSNVTPEQLLEQSHWVLEWLKKHGVQRKAMGISKRDIEDLNKYIKGGSHVQ